MKRRNPLHTSLFQKSKYLLFILLQITLLSGIILVSCGSAAFVQKTVPSSFSYSRFPDSKFYKDVSRLTHGCGRVAPFLPGISSDVVMPVEPAMSGGVGLRTYRIYLPSTYRNDQPLPVVLIFHGYDQRAADIEATTGFSRLAEEENFIAIYPQGLPDGDIGSAFWASVGPIDYGIDDVWFVNRILDDLQHALCVDPLRVYATGFSNGGGMVALLACRLADRIAAFAPVAGNFYAIPGGCHPQRAVPILEIHSAQDRTMPYEGVSAEQNPAWPLPRVMDWLQEWAQRNECNPDPITFLERKDVLGLRWDACSGSGLIEHYRLVEGDHQWPATVHDQSTNTLIWNFLKFDKLEFTYLVCM